MRVANAFSATIIICLSLSAAKAQETTPQLTLDTGGHMSLVKGMAFTADGTQLVSAGYDKTIRIWDVASQRTVRTIRGQTTRGEEGRIYALALSPDNRWLAVAGWMAPGRGVRDADVGDIRLYEFATGELAGLLRGHRDVVNALEFSPDSKRLFSGGGFGDKSAILWDAEKRTPIHRFVGHTAELYAVGFSRDGERLITSSFDKTLKLWSARGDFKELATLSGHKTGIRSIAVSPVDETIASGGLDGEIRLWNGRTGKFLRTLADQGVENIALLFSPDGRRLVSACGGGSRPCSQEPQIVWDVQTGKRLKEVRYHDNVVSAAALTRDGRLVATSGGSQAQIRIWDSVSGKLQQTLVGTGAQRFAVAISSDSKRLAFGSTSKPVTANERGPLELQLALPTQIGGLGRPEPLTAGEWRRGSATYGPYSLGTRQGGSYNDAAAILELKKEGQVQSSVERGSTTGYTHRAYTFAIDGQSIVSGGNGGTLTSYDLKGQSLGLFLGHEIEVWAIAVSPDGRLLASAGGDQTIRLWNLGTRELIATLFTGSDGEWVLWTPQGYYASSPNGDKLVGWQINRGPEHNAEYVSANQLRTQFYRPDIVERAIILASASKAVDEAGRSRSANFQLSELSKRLPPKLNVLTPAPGSETMTGRSTVSVNVAETGDEAVKAVDVFVNDARVDATIERRASDLRVDVPLAQGRNRIRIVARSKSDLLAEASLEVVQNGEGALDKRDRLFILSVGVDDYPSLPKTCGPAQNDTCNLTFAGADAKLFAQTMEKQMGGRHQRIMKQVLHNGAGGKFEPTRDNIEDAFDVLRQAGENDTIAVFVAGHGYNDPSSGYQFLPTNVRVGSSNNFASSSVISWAVLEGAIQAAKGRRLLFVDTCHSGSAYNARLIKDASDGGIVAFSATNMQQEAVELPSLGHGVFTATLVNGLMGAADLAKEKEVRIFDLGAFVEREVRKLTNGRQTPDFYKKPGAENFVLVRM